MSGEKSIEKKRRIVKDVIVATIMQEIHAKQKATHVDSYNPEIFNLRSEWFLQGRLLEDADEHLKNNTNFIRGYDLAMRRKTINEDFYRFGVEHFLSGRSLEEAPSKSASHKYFIMGYEDAKNNNFNLDVLDTPVKRK